MAFTANIVLTTAGSDQNLFNLYSDVDGFVTPFEVNIFKVDLLSGNYYSSNIPDGTTIVRIYALGPCTNYIDIPISGLP